MQDNINYTGISLNCERTGNYKLELRNAESTMYHVAWECKLHQQRIKNLFSWKWSNITTWLVVECSSSRQEFYGC